MVGIVSVLPFDLLREIIMNTPFVIGQHCNWMHRNIPWTARSSLSGTYLGTQKDGALVFRSTISEIDCDCIWPSRRFSQYTAEITLGCRRAHTTTQPRRAKCSSNAGAAGKTGAGQQTHLA